MGEVAWASNCGNVEAYHADCLEWLKSQPDNSVDLVFCSPPYEAARTYGIDFALKGQDWADWCLDRYLECVRVSRGLVAWVVEGQSRKFRYSAAPLLLMADLHRAGVHLRKPPVFHRVGIPGSGGPDWLRNDYEFIICGTSGGKLPWSDNTAMGHPPKWAPGGAMSNRTTDGKRKNARDKPEAKRARVNQWGHAIDSGATVVLEDGRDRSRGKRPSHEECYKMGTRRRPDGTLENQPYKKPILANPGNVIACKVGGGLMGSPLAHENEAPFPESLADWFVLSFCPPGGTVLDIFGGSGTTAASAKRHGRKAVLVDIRESQVELAQRRIATVQEECPLFREAST